MRRNRGAGTPAAWSRWRISCLFLAAEAAATGLDRRPRRAAMAAGLGFTRRVVGVRARGVVGRVQDLDDLGKLFLDEPLDARLQGDVGRAAPLAPAAHLKVDPVVLDVDQLDVAAVAGNRRVDRGVD